MCIIIIKCRLKCMQLSFSDFVVWSPVPDIFVEQISYDVKFMKTALLKAQEFYFQRYMPSVVPCMIIYDERELQVRLTKVDGYNCVTPTDPSGEESRKTACISSASMLKIVLPSSITKTVKPNRLIYQLLSSNQFL